jgi:hypothetical protein
MEQLVRDGKRGNTLCLAAQSVSVQSRRWDRINFVQRCSVWSIENTRFGRWAKKLKEKVVKTGLRIICRNTQDKNVKTICHTIKLLYATYKDEFSECGRKETFRFTAGNEKCAGK